MPLKPPKTRKTVNVGALAIESQSFYSYVSRRSRESDLSYETSAQ